MKNMQKNNTIQTNIHAASFGVNFVIQNRRNKWYF